MPNQLNNVIIIGRMKCGTTSMRVLLRKSGIYFGPKEEHYFNDLTKMEKYTLAWTYFGRYSELRLTL